MGNLCNCNKKKVRRKIVLLLVGLDNAGKTAAAKGLAGESADSVVPTVGFSVVNLNYRNFIVKIFDLGGGPSIRGIWHKYFVDAHGIIFVVDSSDYSRLREARLVLEELLCDEKISKKPVLLLANKQDNAEALDEVEIIEQLNLEELVNVNQCPTLVESCAASSSKSDPKIKKGYEWLLNFIVRNYDNLNERVEKDVAVQNEIEHRLRLAKIERIRNDNLVQNRIDEDIIESYSDYKRKMDNSENQEVDIMTQRSDTTSSGSSSDLVTHFYDENRPKSTMQIIRQQLENTDSNKKPLISRISNKIIPMELYASSPKVNERIFTTGLYLHRSQSACQTRHRRMAQRRLKSASDSERRQKETLPKLTLVLPKKFKSQTGEMIEMETFSSEHRFDGDETHLELLSNLNLIKNQNEVPCISASKPINGETSNIIRPD